MTNQELETKITTLRKSLAAGGFATADDYYAAKAVLLSLESMKAGKTPSQLDPMGHAFGSLSA